MPLYSQSCGFSSSHVWMLELEPKEGWLPENWCFQIVCWGRFFRAPWTARRSNQSILKEICPEFSLEGLMLKLQYFGHLMRRADSLEKTLILGKVEGKRRRGWQRIRWLDSITDSVDMHLSKPWEIVEDRGTWHAAVLGVTKSWTQISNNKNNSRSIISILILQKKRLRTEVVTSLQSHGDWGMGPRHRGPRVHFLHHYHALRSLQCMLISLRYIPKRRDSSEALNWSLTLCMPMKYFCPNKVTPIHSPSSGNSV